MTNYDRRAIGLAVGLSCLAGYVDATGFLATGGLFVSFMSGNSTRLSVGLAENRFAYAGMIFGVICLFILGVIAGTAVSKISGEKRKQMVLLLVAVALTVSATSSLFSLSTLGTMFLVLAMGAENAVFQRDGEVSIGLTYMTGTLVKLGQQITSMLFGGPKDTWLPYALHWLGLVSGAILGARAHKLFMVHSIWPAVGAAFCLTYYAKTFKTENDSA